MLLISHSTFDVINKAIFTAVAFINIVLEIFHIRNRATGGFISINFIWIQNSHIPRLTDFDELSDSILISRVADSSLGFRI